MSSIKIYPPNQLPAEGINDVQFEIWCEQMEVYLEIETKFRKFLPGGKYDTWTPAEQDEKRILTPKGTDTADSLPDTRRELRQFITIVAKYVHQDYYHPIIRHSTSLKWIYKKIREDLNLQQQGIHFFNILDISWDVTEQTTPIGLYNQYRGMIIGNLAKKDDRIEWKNETLTSDEKLTPSHEDLILMNVLQILHPKLPAYIKEHYAHKIGQQKRLMDYKTEILTKAKQYIQEIESPQVATAVVTDDAQCNFMSAPRNSTRPTFRKQQQYPRKFQNNHQPRSFKPASNNQPTPFCRVCQLSGQPRNVFTSHYLGQSTCPSLSSKDKDMLTTRLSQQLGSINLEEEEDDVAREYGYGDDLQLQQQVKSSKSINEDNTFLTNDLNSENNSDFSLTATCSYIQPIATQTLTVQDVNNKDIHLDLDSGATVSYVKLSTVLSHGFQIKPNTQLSNLADGKTKMAAMGEIKETFYRNSWSVKFHAIVSKDLHCDFVAGNNFIKENAIIQDFNAKTITVHKKYTVSETSKSLILPTQPNNLVLQNNHLNVILPGQDVKIPVPHANNTMLAIQPFFQNKQTKWPIPQICKVKNGAIVINSNSKEPVQVKHAAKIQIRTVSDQQQDNDQIIYNTTDDTNNIDNTDKIEVNKEDINAEILRYVHDIHQTYKDVFNDDLSIGYNHRYGKHIAKLNWASPSRPSASKIQHINYDHETKGLLQEVCDDLTNKGVLGIPQDNDVIIQYCSPSFLVRKQKAKNKSKTDLTKSDVRLVVNFTKINDYLKNLPTSVVKPKDIFSQLGKWNYIVAMDLHSGFFQNHMSCDDAQWLGITTPFGGLRYLKRSGQGLIGQSEELDEMLFRVLGHEMKEGKVARIADDIYIGGRDPKETANNYNQVLKKLQVANIKISASKTKVFLKSIDVLGWVWKQGGYLSPSPHRVNALKNTKQQDIINVKDMRSWLGLYKTLLPASPNLTLILNPFDLEVADKESKEPIQWNRDLIQQFKLATDAVDDLQTLYLPHPEDQLLIEVDAAKVPPGIGHTVYAIKEGKKLPVAFHSVKLDNNHAKWMACELEALAFSTAISSEYDKLKECKKPVIISPDSKPVADSIKMIQKGQYSSSPRMQSIINNVNRIPIIVQLASGKSKQNISSDFQSRNPSSCTTQHCSVCNFVNETSDSVLIPTAINSADPEIIMDNKKAWNTIQDQQKACREAKYLLKSGKIPNKQSGKIFSEIRRLVAIAKVDKDNLLVVPSKPNKYSSKQQDLTVIPQTHLPALLWQIHNNLQHPTKAQLKANFDKLFYSVGLMAALEKLYEDCFYCASQKKIPNIVSHHTMTEAAAPGIMFHADVIKRQAQCIFTIRDHFSSLSAAKIIRNESHQELRKALIDTIVPLKLTGECTVKVDNATGFLPLIERKDPELSKLKIVVTPTDVFNKNGNAVIDKGCFELEQELKRIEPDGRAISNTTLQSAIIMLNSRLRRKGQISALEIHFNRDMNTGQNLNLDYAELRKQQIDTREKQNIKHNQKVKPDSNDTKLPEAGDIVVIKQKPDKHKANDVFLVSDRQEKNIQLQRIIHPHSSQANIRNKAYSTTVDRVHLTKQCHIPRIIPPTKSTKPKSIWNPIRTVDYDEEDDDDCDTKVITEDAVPIDQPHNIHIRPQNITPQRPHIYEQLETNLSAKRQKATENLRRLNSLEDLEIQTPPPSQQIEQVEVNQEQQPQKRVQRAVTVATNAKIYATYHRPSKTKPLPQIDGAVTDSDAVTESDTASPENVKPVHRRSSTNDQLLDETNQSDSSADWDYSDIVALPDHNMIFDSPNLDCTFMQPPLNLSLTDTAFQNDRVYTYNSLLASISSSRNLSSDYNPAEASRKKEDANQ